MSRARLRALERADTSVDSAEVGTVAGVDLDLGALLDEQRDRDLGTGLEGCRLGAAGRAVTLQARLCIGDLESHGGRQLDVQGGAIVRGHHHVLVLEHVLGRVADHIGGDVELVVGVAIHEDEVVAVLVQVLHRSLVDVGGVDLGARVEGLVDDLAGEDRLELGPDERRTLAGFDVLELDNGPELVADVEDHAVLEVVGRSQEMSHFRMTDDRLGRASAPKPVVGHTEVTHLLASTNDLKNGMVLNIGNQLWSVVEFQHVKPGKGPAFVRTKLKAVLSGKVVDKTFNAGTKVDTANVDKRTMQYLYKDGDDFVFMDGDTYDQLHVSADVVGDAAQYMLENQDVMVATHDGAPLYVELPASVTLEITYTEPGLQGDRSTGGTKPATLETGAEIAVPLFIEQGTKIKVDTRDGSYLGRVN